MLWFLSENWDGGSWGVGEQNSNLYLNKYSTTSEKHDITLRKSNMISNPSIPW